jgi:hypothetical protein
MYAFKHSLTHSLTHTHTHKLFCNVPHILHSSSTTDILNVYITRFSQGNLPL